MEGAVGDLSVPTSPAEAAQRLEALGADQKWRDAYLAGDGPARKQFDELMAVKHAPVDNLDAIVKGIARPDNISINGQTSVRDDMSVAADLRGLGVPDAAIRQLLEGKPVSKAEYDNIVSLRADRMSDSTWSSAYLKGSTSHQREMYLMNVVIAGGYREEGAAA